MPVITIGAVLIAITGFDLTARTLRQLFSRPLAPTLSKAVRLPDAVRGCIVICRQYAANHIGRSCGAPMTSVNPISATTPLTGTLQPDLIAFRRANFPGSNDDDPGQVGEVGSPYVYPQSLAQQIMEIFPISGWVAVLLGRSKNGGWRRNASICR